MTADGHYVHRSLANRATHRMSRQRRNWRCMRHRRPSHNQSGALRRPTSFQRAEHEQGHLRQHHNSRRRLSRARLDRSAARPSPDGEGRTAVRHPAKKPAAAPSAEEIDRLLAPIASTPTSCSRRFSCARATRRRSGTQRLVEEKSTLKGTPLQDAAVKAGFEPQLRGARPLPRHREHDGGAAGLDDGTRTGLRGRPVGGLFGSIQRLRAQAQKAGNLKDSPQQEVETKTTSSGEQVIVIEPSNPQVVYVPQYNPTDALRPEQ